MYGVGRALMASRKLIREADVVVVGGGMAGVSAALAASRSGSKVLLLEKNGALGGTATLCMLGEMNAYSIGGKRLYGGITAETVEALISEGRGVLMEGIPMSADPSVVVDRVRYDPEYLKILLDELLRQADVTVLFYCYLSGVKRRGNLVSEVIFQSLFEKIVTRGDVFIDATGNVNVAFKANFATNRPLCESLQATSLMFRVCGADTGRLGNLKAYELTELIRHGHSQGFLPAKYLSISPVPGTKDVIINATRMIRIDHELIEDISSAQMEGRQQIKRIMEFLRRDIPGFEKAYLVAIAPNLGIRDRRHIVGKYTLTGKDVLMGRMFDDSIAVGGYPIDIHHDKTQGVVFKKVGGKGIYGIPYRCLLPQDAQGLIVAGKGVSADDEAFASLRVIPTVMAIGEAAGTAASLARKQEKNPDEIDVYALRETLKEQGVVL
jgi:hypothetical protein